MKNRTLWLLAFCLTSCTTLKKDGAHKTDCVFLASATRTETGSDDDEVLYSSVRVNKHKTGTSSGVIINATVISEKDKPDRTHIWVLSTGHMRDRVDPEIEIFFLNKRRLDKPVIVKGNIALLVENGLKAGVDFSLIEATVDATGVSFTPLAPESYTVKNGDKLLSAGCDWGSEPKCYHTSMKGYNRRGGDLEIGTATGVGRSGGGLFTIDRKYVVGVCWGGSGESKTPQTWFTTHKTVRKMLDISGLNEEIKQ